MQDTAAVFWSKHINTYQSEFDVLNSFEWIKVISRSSFGFRKREKEIKKMFVSIREKSRSCLAKNRPNTFSVYFSMLSSISIEIFNLNQLRSHCSLICLALQRANKNASDVQKRKKGAHYYTMLTNFCCLFRFASADNIWNYKKYIGFISIHCEVQLSLLR